MSVLSLWVTYALLAVPVFALLFIWALRAGQFKNQDEARVLPFHDSVEPEPPTKKRPPLAAWAPLLVVGVVLGAMVAAYWISSAHPTGGQ
ncbi:MAG: cbb3-type cytochrome oxidase assembly protein CcoS [Armatimonadia bacterium]|jgi:nitrogen fixation-related uncharacterized protein|nr:cbb3-type cytochrome oxidase assembly protein CcoS [Armatimonadia bacterium]